MSRRTVTAADVPSLVQARENLIDLEMALLEQGMDDATADRRLAELHAQHRATLDRLRQHELRGK